MTLLVLGVALWCAAHLFKRIAPGVRAGMGEPGKGAGRSRVARIGGADGARLPLGGRHLLLGAAAR